MILLLIQSQTPSFWSGDEDGVEGESEEEDLDDEAGDCGVVCEALERRSRQYMVRAGDEWRGRTVS